MLRKLAYVWEDDNMAEKLAYVWEDDSMTEKLAHVWEDDNMTDTNMQDNKHETLATTTLTI
jgi:hypothetical protein